MNYYLRIAKELRTQYEDEPDIGSCAGWYAGAIRDMSKTEVTYDILDEACTKHGTFVATLAMEREHVYIYAALLDPTYNKKYHPKFKLKGTQNEKTQ